ncbi:DUF551 domain-containing protein [Acinetobacter pittii]|uniref:DUF551 domain-containing protein n=1 Tax=Acinetobacter pittii TaxID=48296 RepID=UPI00202A8608|nr:DUF551 domain-containing protein [Acinetobacter pittii]
MTLNERELFESDLAEHLIERDANGFYINDEIQNYWEKHLLKAKVKELEAELEKAKAQAVQQSFEIGRLQDRITELLDERQDLYAQINNDQAVPEWISVKDKLPEITDASVLAHFQNGSIETVHIEDWFKDITDGLDEDGRQKYTKWYLKASNTITHWAPLIMPPIEAEN